MVANVIVGILMSQNFQFMKLNIFNINHKAVATFSKKQNNICATPVKLYRAAPAP